MIFVRVTGIVWALFHDDKNRFRQKLSGEMYVDIAVPKDWITDHGANFHSALQLT